VLRSKGSNIIAVGLVAALSLLLILAGVLPMIKFAEAGNKHNKHSSSSKGITNLKKLGNKIDGLETSSGMVFFGNVETCAPLITCVGTNHDDIIYAGASNRVFALRGNDLVYGGLGNQIYGQQGNDLLIAGPGKSLLDGGPNDDVLLGGLGNDLLVGGTGNDKLFAGPGNTVMFGGPGANHFDCPLSVLGLARGVVMDYNPANGDTISGSCKIVNTIGNSNTGGIPQISLPNTEDSSSSSGSGLSQVVPGLP
jgi:Ca2+-binding RTX toxin-like protein